MLLLSLSLYSSYLHVYSVFNMYALYVRPSLAKQISLTTHFEIRMSLTIIYLFTHLNLCARAKEN